MTRWFPLVVTLSLAGCTAEEPADEVGQSAAALTAVTWTDLVNVSAVGNDLTKSSSSPGFSAGAVSVQTLLADGFVEFTTSEISNKIAGLSSSANSLSRVDFGIRLYASGQARVIEDGVLGGSLGPYSPAARFRVQVEGGVVTYWKNGVLKYTSSQTPTFPLWVDVGLSSPGASIEDVVVETTDFWQNAVGVAVDGNDISKSSGLPGWNAGATSIASIASGDGHVQFTTGETDTAKIAGLSNGNSSQGYADIDFGIMLSDAGGVAVYEKGALVDNSPAYAVGDVFQVRVTGGVVSYWRNGVQFYTSAAAPTYPLLFDSALRTPGATLLDAAIWQGAPPDCTPERQTLVGPDLFGRYDVTGDLMAVVRSNDGANIAAVYRRSGNQWAFEQALTADAAGSDTTVATDGQTVAAITIPAGENQHIAQVFRRSGDQWISEAVIEPCTDDLAGFTSVAVQGDVLALGVQVSIVDGQEGGRVYVYRRNGGTWTLEAILTHFDPQIVRRRFLKVAVAGNWIVGINFDQLTPFRYNAALADPPAPPSCALLDPGKWREKAAMIPTGSDAPVISSLDIDAAGARVVAGDSRRDKVYVFDRSGSTWTSTGLLLAYPSDVHIGSTVALGGADAAGASVVASESRVFAETSTGWTQVDVLPSSSGSRGVTADSVFALDRVYDLEEACFPE